MTKRTKESASLLIDFYRNEVDRLTCTKEECEDLLDVITDDFDRIALTNRKLAADTKIAGLKRFIAELEKDA